MADPTPPNEKEELPPGISSWRQLYLALLGFTLGLILLFYWFTVAWAA
ncbi:MAG: hypothetical protein MUC97_12770 [Bernardetiaceae bacterium]|jgi:hypothetical protein|nr:hypothetical protein [Bernardetiaceae bacterium]